MDIAIVGGGIGGLTLALALHQRGLACRVNESAPEVRELGVGITLLPHAMRYLAASTAAKQARIAAALGVDTRDLDDQQAAARAADAVADLIARLGQPAHLAAYGLSDQDLRAAVAPLAAEGGYAAEDLLAILHAAK